MKKGILLALMLASLGLSACSHHNPKKVQGYIEGRYTYIASPVAGILDNLAVRRGQSIQKKQLLFKLNPEPQLDQVEEARADVASQKASLDDLLKGKRAQVIQTFVSKMQQAKANFIFAKQELKRMRVLFEKTYEGKQSLQKAYADYNAKKAILMQTEQQITVEKLKARVDQILAAKGELKSAEAKLHQEQWLLKEKTQYSPKNSFVYNTFYYDGESVPANAPVLALATPGNVYALFYLKAPQIARLKLGDKVTLNCDSCHATQAKIAYIGDRAEYSPPMLYSRETSDRLVYRVEATPESSKTEFHPGQPVTVTLP